MHEADPALPAGTGAGKSGLRIGAVIGRWTILSEAAHTLNNRGTKLRWWNCRCSCGTERAVRASTLIRGDSRSCGCLAREVTALRSTTHGETLGHNVSSEHKIWTAMRYRCGNPNDTSYDRYGGRGIRVCQRWEESFEAFLFDMGRRPSRNHSIERINNGGHYEPGNCRWATARQQGNNKRNNRIIRIAERSQTVAQWAREKGVAPRLIWVRLGRGWSEESAVMTPKGLSHA